MARALGFTVERKLIFLGTSLKFSQDNLELRE